MALTSEGKHFIPVTKDVEFSSFCFAFDFRQQKEKDVAPDTPLTPWQAWETRGRGPVDFRQQKEKDVAPDTPLIPGQAWETRG